MNRQRYHVVASVNGNVYTAWQARVCYYWYNKAREQDTAGVMGGFTRLLHRCWRLASLPGMVSVQAGGRLHHSAGLLQSHVAPAT